jgi:amino acid adenylation domain-containing protein
MTATEVLARLQAANARVEVQGEDLRVSAPRGALTPDLVEALERRKAELLRLLRNREGPLSFAQERMWFLDRMEPGTTAYNRPFAFRLEGELDVGALEDSLREIHRRHEPLRTCFPVRDGEPVRSVETEPSVEFRVVDLGSFSGGERGARLRDALEEEAGRPFDLAHGPLARYLLVRLGSGEHAFLHTTHHAVTDGWSSGIFHRELEALYAHRVDGSPEALAPLPTDYGTYLAAQRDLLRGGGLDEQLAFWKDRLGDHSAPLDLPLDRPRPSTQTYRGAVVSADLPAADLRRLRAVAREEGATPFMALLAVFVLLLHRYSGQDDLTVGVPVAGRRHRDVEALIGLFVNTLPVRADLSGDPTFRDVLHRVRASALEAYAHQDVPFEKMVEVVDPRRSASYHPLFQVLFTHRDGSDGGLALTGIEVTPIEVLREGTYMDLDMSVEDGPGDGARLTLRYNTDYFDPGTAEGLLRHYRALLEGAAEGADVPASTLPILAAPERERIVVEWNATDVDFGTPTPVHEMVEAQARRTPHRTAVTCAQGDTEYGELVRRAAAIAERLRAEGVVRGSVVGVATGRNVTMVASVLGVMGAGGTYLPLDPALPGDRLAYILRDAGARVVIADREGRDALPDVEGLHVLDIPALLPVGSGAPGATGGATVGPEDLAYLIYTSGSTGRPKGVEVSHGAVFNFLESMRRAPGIAADEVVLAPTTLSFDISVLELFLPLIVGARVVVAGRDVAHDGRLLLDAIRAHGVTMLQATPATWRLLMEAGWDGSEALRVLTGGEALPPDLARKLVARSDEVWNLYGPTETTVWSARYRLPPEGEPVRIGRPIENTRLYVLDRAGRPVPVGVPGELCIGGAGVARGYRARPDLDARSFVPDPFSPDADGRLYHTGDRCRYRPDGNLEFLGRWDHQVKVRGFRIELGEIEAVLRNLDEVEEAVAAVLQDDADDQRLVAYVTYRADRQATSSEIRGRLREMLPDYMIPSFVVEVASFPLTPSGKVDRDALPDPLGTRPRSGPSEDPVTRTEQIVARIWSDLLGVGRVGRRDNFFDLGGHSLLSMRVVHRIEERTGARLNPRALILDTLEQVAAEVERAAEDVA